MSKYDVAAYIWPSYTGDEPRSRMFWREGMGEWQSVRSAEAKFEGHTWPRKPLWGYVNEADPYVMEMEIAAAADHGVNVFIYDWYWYDGRPFLEQCLDNGFLKAKNNSRMKFWLMWANHDANQTWNKELSDTQSGTVIWRGATSRAEFENVVHRVIGMYFSHPCYYKINGCPVFQLYDLANLVRGLGGAENTRRALDWFREETVKAGFPGLHLMLTAWSERSVNLSGVDSTAQGTTKDAVRLFGFDSITHYQFVHYVNIDRPYPEILPDVRAEWARLDAEYNVPYFPHISVGWDNNPRFKKLRRGIMRDTTPENIEAGFRMAREYADTHDLPVPLITLNSWNEWTETSYLEPDDRNGYAYLEAVKRVFGA